MKQKITVVEGSNVAHNDDPIAGRFNPTVWQNREPGDEEPYGLTHRTCSFCGSMHPLDLLALLKKGARLELADMKYGFPHKIYVSNIPNTKSGTYTTYATCGSKPSPHDEGWEEYDTGYFNRYDGTPEMHWRKPSGTYPIPETAHGKFYTVHFRDIDGEDFDALAALIYVQTHYRFYKDASTGNVMYQRASRAPSPERVAEIDTSQQQ